MPTVYANLRYQDASRAIDWLVDAFGLTKGLAVPGPDGSIVHAELSWRGDVIMLGATRPGERLAAAPGMSGLYLAVEDPDAHHARAVAAGAEIVFPLHDEDYGSRGYTARDPEGNVWSFGTYQPAAGS